jgi:hypothetical protein
MKNIFAILVLLMAFVGMAGATMGVLTQTTPTLNAGTAVTWTSVTSSNPFEYNVSMESEQLVLVNCTGSAGTTITIYRGIGQTAPIGNTTVTVTPSGTGSDVKALKLESSRFEQANGTVVMRTSQNAKVAVLNLHPLFY